MQVVNFHLQYPSNNGVKPWSNKERVDEEKQARVRMTISSNDQLAFPVQTRT